MASPILAISFKEALVSRKKIPRESPSRQPSSHAMNQFACFLLATLLAFSSPVRFDVERLDSVSREPATDVVHVYYNMRDVKQPYQAIGLITVNYEKKDQWNLSDETKLIDKVIGCARELGANGLILEVSQPQLNGPVSMRGTAIVLT
jgi:hypothetical protein